MGELASLGALKGMPGARIDSPTFGNQTINASATIVTHHARPEATSYLQIPLWRRPNPYKHSTHGS